MARNLRAVAKAIQNPAAAPAQGGFSAVNGVAGYGNWTHGTALPRQPQEFLNGAFGPLMPMNPVPLDQPDPGTERPDPRRTQYPVGWNMPIGAPGNEGLKLASFANLRTVADTYSVARACIEIRIKEILGLEWDITPTKEAEKKMRGDKEAHREFGERRAKALKFFKKPDPNYNTFQSWMNSVLEDVFVIDAMSLFLHPSRKKGKGLLGTNLAALDVIDGSTVRPLLDLRGGKPLPPNAAYQTYEYGVPRVDLMTALDGTDIEELGESLVQQYCGDQLLYLPYLSRSWTPYGFPPVERSLVPTLSGLQRQRYQLDYFSEGTIPGVFISSGDPGSSPQQLRDLQDALNAMAGDPAWKHKIIVLPKDSKIDSMRPVSLADQFDEIIMTQVCMAFEVMPMELGISPKVSTTQSPGAANQMAKASSDINNRKAIKPLLLWLKASIFDYVLQTVCGMDDMQWTWNGLEQGEDEGESVDLLKTEIAGGLKSIDEGRIARGMQPWGLEITSNPVYFTGTGIIPIAGLDPENGRPKGDPAPGSVPPGAGHAAPGKPQPSDGEKKPASGAAKATPGHAAASGHDAQNTRSEQRGSSGKSVNTVSALRELDLVRRRLNKGRSIADWTPEAIPTDVFATLTADVAVIGADRAVNAARAAVKALDHRGRRDTAIRAAEDQVAYELDQLAADLTAGRISTAAFVDAAVDALRSGIRYGLSAGGHQAMLDAGWTWLNPVPGEATKAAPNSGRYKAYAGSVAQAYNEGYGLVTIGTATDPDNIVVRWHAKPGACELCGPRDGELFTVGTLPGWPGDGGFGAEATICLGGPHCRCTLSYETATDAEIAEIEAVHEAAAAQETPAVAEGGPRTRRRPDAAAQRDNSVQQRTTDLVTVREALAQAAPLAAVGDVWEDLAIDRAEAQRPYLMGLLRDVLTAANTDTAEPVPAPQQEGGAGFPWLATAISAAVAAGIAAQAASQAQPAVPPPTQPAPVEPEQIQKSRRPEGIGGDVYDYLRRHYPRKTLKWVKGAEWSGPVDVDLADVNMARRPGGARDPKKVEGIARDVADGKELDPVVLVETPDGLPYRIADGFHRTLALDHLGRTTVRAWIGKVPDRTGPWAKEMHEEKLNKYDPNQLRDYRGRWTDEPGQGPAAVATMLRSVADHIEAVRQQSTSAGRSTAARVRDAIQPRLDELEAAMRGNPVALDVLRHRLNIETGDADTTWASGMRAIADRVDPLERPRAPEEPQEPERASREPNAPEASAVPSEPEGPQTPRHTKPEQGKPKKPKKPAIRAGASLADLIPADSPTQKARTQITAAVEKRLNGSYAGLDVKVEMVRVVEGKIDVWANIYNARGNKIGSTHRAFRRGDDTDPNVIHARHERLTLTPGFQGQGFAQAWNAHLNDWYRESGTSYVTTTANIDVGGYTWARSGFDFADQEGVNAIRKRLRTVAGDASNGLTRAQRTEARAMVRRLGGKLGSADFPTAYEVSQLGRIPGQDARDDMWPGKQAMLGSEWEGVKWLPR